MDGHAALELPRLTIKPEGMSASDGRTVLSEVLRLAHHAVEALRARSGSHRPMAALGRLRGTGRGIHFSHLIDRLERDHPIKLKAPFECSDLVSGAAWDSEVILGPGQHGALAKLRWAARADDLPMHVHEHSDRFIVVHEGRGFFHVSDQTVDAFDGSDVRSIPARERDVFLFTRGIVHTFSTLDKPMTLFSCQLPFMPFNDPRQYRLPRHRWTARDNPEPRPPSVGCDPAWTVLARQTTPPAAAGVLAQIHSVTPLL